jgi:prophage maintenance system killer protein
MKSFVSTPALSSCSLNHKVSEDNPPKFLSTDEVRRIHRRVAPLVPAACDVERLESAVRAVESYACYGEPDDLFDIATSYAFYISEAQQVFLDGHKRTALAACLDFVRINGVPTEHYDDWDLFDWMMELATKRIDRVGFAERLRSPFREQ